MRLDRKSHDIPMQIDTAQFAKITIQHLFMRMQNCYCYTAKDYMCIVTNKSETSDLVRKADHELDKNIVHV